MENQKTPKQNKFATGQTKFNTYSAFPPEIHENFIKTYALPYRGKFEECIDLGCGSGGLSRALLKYRPCRVVGVDISDLSIDRCLADPYLKKNGAGFLLEDVMNLTKKPDFKNRFDLLMSYSVFHIVSGSTPSKFKLFKNISKPGAIIAIDSIPNIAWNRVFYFFIRNAFKWGIGGAAIRLIGPWALPHRSKTYIEELSRLDYMKDFFFVEFY